MVAAALLIGGNRQTECHLRVAAASLPNSVTMIATAVLYRRRRLRCVPRGRRLRAMCAGAAAVDQQRRDAGPPRTVFFPAWIVADEQAILGAAGEVVQRCAEQREGRFAPPHLAAEQRPSRSARPVRAARAPHATPAAVCPTAHWRECRSGSPAGARKTARRAYRRSGAPRRWEP